jgi:hypothetical protein
MYNAMKNEEILSKIAIKWNRPDAIKNKTRNVCSRCLFLLMICSD